MIKTETVEYKQGSTVCEGFLAYDDAKSGKRPGILVVHEWNGMQDYMKQRSQMLAELGYVAFAPDIFGKGVRAQTMEECAKISEPYYKDRMLQRARAQAGLDVLRGNANVDPAKIVAIGYCFGGMVVLEMARAGMKVAGVVSFHGQFATPMPAKSVSAKVLVLHGNDDPVVPPEEVLAFEKEMTDARADWQLVAYGGAKHTFTNYNLPTDLPGPAAYNEKADKRSWIAMKEFFRETFGG
ncbi:MAG TPA: dienelactone hydrolase family protein [Stellaceae bacterium]|nr:dienelactone hydrolase family protein [Stellaceae bacterium]